MDAGVRVALNSLALTTPLTGIGQYVLHLAAGLLERSDVNAQLFYGDSRFSRTLRTGAPPSVGRRRALVRKLVPRAYAVHRLVTQFRFNQALAHEPCDLYHEPNYLAYRFDGPSVITVHDLSWIRYPETHPVERVQAMDKFFEPGLRRARLLLTDSVFVKQELIDVFGIAPELIQPIALGLDPVFRPMDATQTQAVLAARGLAHGRYLLSVGTLEPRKNMQATVAAYASLPAAVRERHPLVLAGMKGWRTSRLEQLLEPLERQGHVRILGYLEREELATITAGALAMVYPSVYEGFGLPPLEAMGCGVPAITSNVSSLPEVVGDTGLTVHPDDHEALARAMVTMMEDAPLRASLSARAYERATTFTWARCVDETVAAYRRAAASTTSR